MAAGWMTKDFTSATLASREKISRLSMNLWISSCLPLTSKVKIEAPPLGNTSYAVSFVQKHRLARHHLVVLRLTNLHAGVESL